MNILAKTTCSKMFGLGHISRITSVIDLFQAEEIYYQIDYDSPIKVKAHRLPNHKIYSTNYNLPLSRRNLKKISVSNLWDMDLDETLFFLKHFKIDLLICDLPAISVSWLERVRRVVKVVMFDDIPLQHIEADIIINPNNSLAFSKFYKSNNNKIYIGPEYNPTNLKYRKFFCEPKYKCNSVLIYLGSGVSKNIVLNIIKILNETRFNLIYVGEHAKLVASLYPFCECHEFVAEMRMIYEKADLCIGACGISFWERCHFGIPSFLLFTAENQLEDLRFIRDNKMMPVLEVNDLKLTLHLELEKIIKNKAYINFLSKQAFNIVSKSYEIDLKKIVCQ